MYNQYELVEGGSKIHYIYLEFNTVHEMCPETKTIEYILKALFDIINYFKETREMLDKF